MKNFKRYLGFAIFFALLTTSCSKDSDVDDQVVDPTATATLSFATVLNDLMANKAALKQAVGEIPACSDATPDHVAIVLNGPDGNNVGSMAEPVIVDINPTPANYDEDPELEYFTEESADLELAPGIYTLEYFVVYDASGNEMWVAPMESGDLAAMVDNPLPIEINLDAGVKKYVDVEVLCFDDRVVNEYGYLFFDIEKVRAVEFCFFANYCDDNGRHFPAAISVDFWLGTDSSGIPLYNDVSNTTGFYENGEAYARPVCFALPDLDTEGDYLYYEVTLQSWSDVYGEVEQSVISGTLSREDIMANFVDEDRVDYEHLRFGCGEDPGNGNGEEPDADEDGIPDEEDECVNEAGPADNNGCPLEQPTDTDEDGTPDTEDECDNEAGPADNNGCPVEEPADSDGDGIPDTEDECDNEAGPADNNGCPVEQPTDTDGDGIPDNEDNCPDEAGTEANNGCPDAVELCTIADPTGTGCITYTLGESDSLMEVTDDGPINITVDGVLIGSFAILIEDGSPRAVSELTGEGGFLWTGYQIYLSSSSSSEDIFASECGTVDNSGTLSVDFGDLDVSYPIYVQVKANLCPANP